MKDFSKLCINNTLEEKIRQIKELFKENYKEEFEIFTSSFKHYRTRAELSFYHKDDDIFYAMFDEKTKKKYIIDTLDFCDEKICNLMPLLLDYIKKNFALKEKLFGVEFLASKKELSVTLLYHKDINLIEKELSDLSKNLQLNLIARSKKKKLIFQKEILTQNLNIFDKEFIYEFNNDCFIQPNTLINEKMIEWVLTILKQETTKDLLELYCGYGNFTIALASCFKKVLATELSKKNIQFALKNCELNQISNIDFIRLSSEELSQAFKKEREFNRLKHINLDDFNFSHVLVDPPRSGLNKEVINLIKNYNNIIYISCNPLSLKENLDFLLKTHQITKFALFDQFVHTKHLECGILLKKI